MLRRCFLLCALALAPSLPSVATTDIVHFFGRNIVLTPDQPFHNASCVLCSVLVEGHGSGSVRVFAGNAQINGSIAGRVVVFGGDVRLGGNGWVGKRVIVFGGHFSQESAGPGPARTVMPPIVFLPLILLVCVMTGGLILMARRAVRGPRVYPPLPRL